MFFFWHTLQLKSLLSIRKYYKESNTFIQKGHIKLIKSYSKNICYKRFWFQINAVHLNFPFNKEFEKIASQFPQ